VKQVQVWLHREGVAGSEEAKAPAFSDAPWVDATILGPPRAWGAIDEKLLRTIQYFSGQGEPKTWPIRLAKLHWAVLLPPVK
jgi:hypothetical protein